jgi:biopolymer transport protein ExbB
MNGIGNVFARGGLVMWPLLACSLLTVTITLERVLFWWREGRRARRGSRTHEIFGLAEAGRFGEALTLEREGLGAAERMLLEGLANREHGLREGMEAAAGEEVERMRRGLGVLDTIITLAPLLGILGTVVGIILAFDFLGSRGIADPRAVTSGIAQALITTAAGLAVALVTLVPYNMLVHRVEKTARALGRTGTRFEAACRKGEDHEGRHRV